MEGGYVFSWGTGYLGQLGLGDDSSWDTPRMIRHLDPKRLSDSVKAVVCGGSHSGVVTTSGSIYMWGLNRNGQTGTGVKVESVLEPRGVDLTDIGRKQPKQLVCGRNHTMLLTTEGRVFAWGAGGCGRLGLSETRKNQYTPLEVQFFRSRPAQDLVSGDFHSVALGVDGRVYTWGYNLEGQCGNGGTMNQRIPKQIEFPFDLLGAGTGAEYQPNSSTGRDPMRIQHISCGSSWSHVLTASGALYAWGYGDGGWFGLEPLDGIPYIESELPPPSGASSQDPSVFYSSAYSRSFDSNINLLRPLPVTFFLQNNLRVKWLRSGGGHTIYCVEEDETMASIGAMAGVGVMETMARRSEAKDDVAGPGAGDSKRAAAKDSKYSVKESSPRGGDEAGAVPSHLLSGQFGQFPPASVSLSTFMSWIRHKKVGEIHAALSQRLIDLHERDENGNTSLHIACQNGHLNICKILLDYDQGEAEVEEREGQSGTLVRLVNEQNNKGNTALHYTIAYGYREISDYLIAAGGADEYVVNGEGLTCYEGLKREDLEKI
jgi:hypothetical protein